MRSRTFCIPFPIGYYRKRINLTKQSGTDPRSAPLVTAEMLTGAFAAEARSFGMFREAAVVSDPKGSDIVIRGKLQNALYTEKFFIFVVPLVWSGAWTSTYGIQLEAIRRNTSTPFWTRFVTNKGGVYDSDVLMLRAMFNEALEDLGKALGAKKN